MYVEYAFLRLLAEVMPSEELSLVVVGTEPLTMEEAPRIYEPLRETRMESLAESIGIKASTIQNASARINIITALRPYASVSLESRNIDTILREYSVVLEHDFHNQLFKTRQIIGVDATHEEGYTGEGVKIAVIDTGVDDTHPDIEVSDKFSVIPGQYTDDDGHGTHVAGIACGRGIYRGEYRGVAPDAELISVKVLDSNGNGTNMGVAKGVEIAILEGADIINLSLGGIGNERTPEYQIAEEAWRLGKIVVAAAGNDGEHGWGTVGSPGCVPEVICVGATNKSNIKLAEYSSKGPGLRGVVKPDILAPGGDLGACSRDLRVISTLSSYAYSLCTFDGKYQGKVGTSMATPHVSGASAIILQVLRERGFKYYDRELADTVKWILLSTARRLEGYSIYEQGAGLIDIPEAIRLAKETNTPRQYVFPREKPPLVPMNYCREIRVRKIPEAAVPLLIEISKRYELPSLGKMGKLALRLLEKKKSEEAFQVLNMEISTMKLREELELIENIEAKTTGKKYLSTIRKLRAMLTPHR